MDIHSQCIITYSKTKIRYWKLQTLDHQSSNKIQCIQISVTPAGIVLLTKSGDLQSKGSVIKEVSSFFINPNFSYEIFALKSKKLYKSVLWNRPNKSVYLGKQVNSHKFIELACGTVNYRIIIKESYALTLEAQIGLFLPNYRSVRMHQ
jgi:hypothetical protein